MIEVADEKRNFPEGGMRAGQQQEATANGFFCPASRQL